MTNYEDYLRIDAKQVKILEEEQRISELEKRNSFVFQGHEILTSYGKHLVKYLKTKV